MDSPYFARNTSPRSTPADRPGGGRRRFLPATARVRLDRGPGWFTGRGLSGPGDIGPVLPQALLSAAGVQAFTFDHVVDVYPDLGPWVEERRPSPFMDVTGGLAGYVSRASKSGRDKMTEARRLTTKAGRDLGEVNFVLASTDPADLDQVIALKREQYALTGARDHFADSTQRDLLHRLLSSGLGLLSTSTRSALVGRAFRDAVGERAALVVPGVRAEVRSVVAGVDPAA